MIALVRPRDQFSETTGYGCAVTGLQLPLVKCNMCGRAGQDSIVPQIPSREIQHLLDSNSYQDWVPHLQFEKIHEQLLRDIDREWHHRLVPGASFPPVKFQTNGFIQFHHLYHSHGLVFVVRETFKDLFLRNKFTGATFFPVQLASRVKSDETLFQMVLTDDSFYNENRCRCGMPIPWSRDQEIKYGQYRSRGLIAPEFVLDSDIFYCYQTKSLITSHLFYETMFELLPPHRARPLEIA